MSVHTCNLVNAVNKTGIFKCEHGVEVEKTKQALDEKTAQHILRIGDRHLECTEGTLPGRQLTCKSLGGGMHQKGSVRRDHTCAGDVYEIGDKTYRLCEHFDQHAHQLSKRK